MEARHLPWLGLLPEDEHVVSSLALPFATAAAATVVATSSKASFLATHPIKELPWVFAAQAIWSIASSLAFVRLLRRWSWSLRGLHRGRAPHRQLLFSEGGEAETASSPATSRRSPFVALATASSRLSSSPRRTSSSCATPARR